LMGKPFTFVKGFLLYESNNFFFTYSLDQSATQIFSLATPFLSTPVRRRQPW